jgi:dolichyl-phosphate beta-glucosyltransferase
VPPLQIAVVVPAFNEARRLGVTLERVLAFLERRGEPFEVVVVDDGSTDETAALAGSFGSRGVTVIELPVNRGKGAAVRTGVLATAAGRVLISDADLSTPIEEVTKLERALAEADLVVGSRAMRGARITVHQPLHRELAGKTFNLLIRLAGVRGVRDTQCGFKLLRGDRVRPLFAELVVDRYAWDVELVWLAGRRGMRVVEVGVEWRNDPSSHVRLARDAPRMLFDIARFRWRHRGAAGNAA